eukprot:TRINITY_DN3517_c0_g1_i1.p1 TRINITY_DN3517_c0_g1~~TRINITY_DN3517_c0_g1_i1.p1  ORF type:complete len:673 (+),score=135.36 TRINITY_DN3517_c0_g1_i1:209-2227(+)
MCIRGCGSVVVRCLLVVIVIVSIYSSALVRCAAGNDELDRSTVRWWSSTPDNAVYSSYRKDYYLSPEVYREQLPDPTVGGRVHVISTSMTTGSVGSVFINQQLFNLSAAEWSDWDWLNIWPLEVTKGAPVWVSFHSRDPVFDTPEATLEIALQTQSGDVVFQGNINHTLHETVITYVTTDVSFETLLLYVHNNASSDDSYVSTILGIELNGFDVTSVVTPSLPIHVMSSQTVLFKIPSINASLSVGDLWTIAVRASEGFVGGPQEEFVSGYGGRVVVPYFPIEVWPDSSDCPFPGANTGNYEFHRNHSIDTFFVYGTTYCNGVTGDVITNQLATQYNFWVLPTTDVPVTNYSRVIGRFLADENDQSLANTRPALQNNVQSWIENPQLPTYQGGSRNKLDGSFAGITDIQGTDMYIAACAPHVEEYLHPPPPRGSYDYCRNTRNNHMPLPTWTYSQGIFGGWDFTFPVIDKTIHRQPDPDELKIQMMSVVAAGAKGLMLFQSSMSELPDYPDSFQQLGLTGSDIALVREFLREGDVTDMIQVTDVDFQVEEAVVAQMILSPNALVVVVINTYNDGGYDDIQCSIGEDLHWKFLSVTLNIEFQIPYGFSISSFYEIQNGNVIPITPAPQVSSTSVVLPGVELPAAQLPSLIARMYLFLDNSTVAQNWIEKRDAV